MKQSIVKIFIIISFLILGLINFIYALDLILKLPYQKGEKFIVSRGYETKDTHVNKDKYALDFTKEGCKAYGKPVLAVVDGMVNYLFYDTGSGQGYGNAVKIDHGNNLESIYAHLKEFIVEKGQEIKQGQVIGYLGNTGYVKGSACPEHPGTHLHFAMYQKQPDGKLVAYKPEPMSGYTNFVAGNWYVSDNEVFQTKFAEEQQTQFVPSQPEQPQNFWQSLGSFLAGLGNFFNQTWQSLTGSVENLLGTGEQEEVTNQELGITNQELTYDAKLTEKNPNQNFALKENQVIALSVKFRNIGTMTWRKEVVSLNVASEEAKNFYHSSWLTQKRPTRLREAEVKPNEIGSFEFLITAQNLESKNYQTSFRPVYQDATGFHWLGAEIVSWQIAFLGREEKIVLKENLSPLGSLGGLNLFDKLFGQEENLLETERTTEERLTPVQYFGGGGGSPSLPLDTTPPEITLTAYPKNLTNLSGATFEFFANETTVFKCKVDNQEKEDCSSPKIYENLSEGEHSFFLEAFDSAGNQSSLVYLWQIDLTSPTSTITTTGIFIGQENLPQFIEGTFEGEDTEKIEVAIQRESDSQYLAQQSPFTWQEDEFWLETSLNLENKTWQFAWPREIIEEGNYQIYSRAKDRLGNQQEPASQSSLTYLIRPFLGNWIKRKVIVINNQANENLTNFEINVVINYQPEMKLDFSDIRFTDEDGQTLLNYGWEIDEAGNWKKLDGQLAEAVVRVPFISANSQKRIYLYYGNPSAGAVADLEKTLTWFDHFDRQRIDGYDFGDVAWLIDESKIQIGVGSVGWLMPKLEIKNFWLKARMARGGPNGSTFLYWRYLNDGENSWQIHSGSTNWLYDWAPFGTTEANWGYMKDRTWYELGCGVLWEGQTTLWEVKSYETKHSVEVKDVLPFGQSDQPVFNHSGKILILDWWSCWWASCPWIRPWDWRTFVDYLYIRQYVEPMPVVYF